VGGLVVRGDGPLKKQAQYIEEVGRATLIRTLEQEILEEKKLKKEREESGVVDEEVFVTSGYQARLQERVEAQKKLDVQDAEDLANCVTRQGAGKGFGLAGLAKGVLQQKVRGREDHAAAVIKKEEPTPVKKEPGADAAATTDAEAPEGSDAAAAGAADVVVKSEPGEGAEEAPAPPAEEEHCVPEDWDLDKYLEKKRLDAEEERQKAEWKEAQKKKRASTDTVEGAKARYLARKMAKKAEEGGE
jgi:hypothetical protein